MPTTAAKGYSVQTTGSNAGVWGAGTADSLNEGVFEIMDANMGGVTSKSLSNVNVTLSSTESRNLVVRLTGTLTGAVQITTSCVGFFYIENVTTGAFAVTIYNGFGSPVDVDQGYRTGIIADTTNGCRKSNDAPGEVFVASGASAAEGLVPSPGSTAGAGRYLREDATFVVPPFQWTPGGRLTLTSGVPVTTSDVTAASTVYYCATNGNTVPIYGSCAPAPTQFAPVTITGGELSLALNNPNHAANTNYDVFAFLDGSTVRIGTGPLWSSSTTRGTGAATTQISLLNGLWVNTVSITARNGASTYSVDANKATYLGTIRTGSTAGTTDDSRLNRFVFNAYNQVSRSLYVTETTNSWVYSAATWRQTNGSTANQFSVVLGLTGSSIEVYTRSLAAHSTANIANVVASGVGINSTTVNSAQVYGCSILNIICPVEAEYVGYPSLGLSVIAWLEIGNVTFADTWYGDNGLTSLSSGMTGTVFM